LPVPAVEHRRKGHRCLTDDLLCGRPSINPPHRRADCHAHREELTAPAINLRLGPLAGRCAWATSRSVDHGRPAEYARVVSSPEPE